MYIDYLFEVVGEDSELCGEEFFVEIQSGIDSFKQARAIAEQNFPGEKLKAYGPFTVEEAEAMGLDTY